MFHQEINFHCINLFFEALLAVDMKLHDTWLKKTIIDPHVCTFLFLFKKVTSLNKFMCSVYGIHCLLFDLRSIGLYLK